MKQMDVGSVGILGAGKVGTAIGRSLVAAGYDVAIATHRPPEEIALLVEVTVPGARVVTAAEAAATDLVVLAIPMHRYAELPPELLASRTVIDVMNYWPPVDGHVSTLDRDERSSSELVQEHLVAATVVRTLNHIGYHEIEEDALPPGTPGRRALAIASDDATARSAVAAVIDAMGFDAVDAGPLAAARSLQQGGEIFDGRRHTADQIRQVLTADGFSAAA